MMFAYWVSTMKKLLFIFSLAFVVPFFIASVPRSVLDDEVLVYAGIEIGAKGVKLCVIKELHEGNKSEIVSVMERTANTEVVRMDANAFIRTSWAVRNFLDSVVNEYNIPKDKVFVVVSSGVKQVLDKANKNEEMRQALRNAIDERDRVIYYVQPEQEAELLASGVIAPSETTNTGIFDIGGGNTKGGYFVLGKFTPFSLPYGTKSTTNLVSSITDSIPIFSRKLDSIMQARVRGEILTQMTPAKTARETYYLSGGIVWLLNSYLHPERGDAEYSEISMDDMIRFKAMAVNDYEALTHPKVADGKDPVLAQKIDKNLIAARASYDRKAVVAGATLLLNIAQVYSTPEAKVKKFVFVKYAYMGWIRSLVRQAAATKGGKPQLAVL